jgi:hypothetical protein
MQLSTLLSTLDRIENSPKQSIFESIGQGDQYFRTWERDIHPVLCEVALQPDQIQQLFKSIETGAGRSALGKAGDMVKGAANKVSDVWFNKFGGMLQSSGPVQAFDQKFEEIKSSIAAKNPKLAAQLAKYGEFAKNNPNLHKFLLAIAGSAAAALGVAVAGGVGAGALAVGTGTGIAVGIVNIADRLLQGQKASTAIGRGATAGAVAGLTAAGISKAKDMLDTLGAVKTIKRVASLEINGTTVMLNPEDAAKYSASVQASMKATSNLLSGGADAMRNLGATMDANSARQAGVLADILSRASDPEYQKAVAAAANQVIKPGAIGAAANAVSSALSVLSPVLSAITGQAVAGAKEKPTATAPVKESLNRTQLNELFGITGNKVDASKLEKAWKKAGSPTDSEEVAKILQSAGVDPAVISKTYTDMSIPEPAGKVEPTLDKPADAPINTKDLMDKIKALSPEEQKQVLAYLKR